MARSRKGKLVRAPTIAPERVFHTPSPKFDDLFRPARYKVFHGGRGSGKSQTFAGALIAIASRARIRVLCTRELQNSIADSVHKLLVDQIEKQGHTPFFVVTLTSIKCPLTGSEFMFKGLRHNVNEIKSTEGIDICWVEEAQRVSQASWEVLIPTIRKEGSEIWLSFNPENEDDPTYLRFVKSPPPNTIVQQVNYADNKFFPSVLVAEMEYMKRVDYDAYLHVWEGQPKRRSKSQIFSGKYRVDVFDPPADADFMHGADWGFAQDPNTLIRCYIVGRTLYIDQEAYGVGVDLDEIPQLWDGGVPDAKRARIYADSARPETISHLVKHGYDVRSVEKWAGSVEDGIAHMRSYEEIVIHERCKRTIEEFRLYSYKTDRVTDEVLPVIIDKHNHCIDAIRYAMSRLIRKVGTNLLHFMANEAEKTAAGSEAPAVGWVQTITDNTGH